MGTHLNCDAIQMSTHNICFYNEKKKKNEKNTQKHCISIIWYLATSFPIIFEKYKCDN